MAAYGIDEFREMVRGIVEIANTVDKTMQDGFQLTDLLDFIKPLSKVPGMLKDAEKIPLELSDYDPGERAIIEQDIKELEFGDEYAELIAEQAVKTSVEFALLLVVITMSKNGEPLQDIYDFLKRIYDRVK